MFLFVAVSWQYWRRQWHPTPVLLPGKSHGRRSLVGCSPWGSWVGHDWATSLSLFTFTHWRRKWQPTQVFLPGESQDGGAWCAALYGVAQSWTRLKWLSSSSSICNSLAESGFNKSTHGDYLMCLLNLCSGMLVLHLCVSLLANYVLKKLGHLSTEFPAVLLFCWIKSSGGGYYVPLHFL